MRRLLIIGIVTLTAVLFIAPMSMAAATTTTNNPTALKWGVSAGSSFTVDNNIGMSISATTATWNLIDQWFNQTMNETIDAQSVFTSAMYNLPTDFGIKVAVTSVTSVNNTDVLGDSMDVDTINGTLTTCAQANASDPTYVDPATTLAQELTVEANALAPLFSTDPTYAADMSSEETLIGAATGHFTNIQVSQWDSNATYIGAAALPAGMPVAPFDCSPVGDGSYLIKPMQCDFSARYTYMQALYAYEYNNSTASEKAMMPSTFTSLLNQLGISEIYVDSNAISCEFNVANINESMPLISSEFSDLNATGELQQFTGTVTMGVEYSPTTGALQRLGLWYNGTDSLNLGNISVPLVAGYPAAASSGSEIAPLTVSMGTTVTQAGLTPLTQSVVASGQVGQKGAYAPSSTIDGYATIWLTIVGLGSVIAIMFRKRMH